MATNKTRFMNGMGRCVEKFCAGAQPAGGPGAGAWSWFRSDGESQPADVNDWMSEQLSTLQTNGQAPVFASTGANGRNYLSATNDAITVFVNSAPDPAATEDDDFVRLWFLAEDVTDELQGDVPIRVGSWVAAHLVVLVVA
jgi:hypothetical protein